MAEAPQRFVLLNRLVSRSSTRARQEHHLPTHGAEELLRLVEARLQAGLAVEFLNCVDHRDETVRIANGQGHDFIRMRQIAFSEGERARYATLLIEHVDSRVRSFPVVHTVTYRGRELAGDDEERGASASHLVVRLPLSGAYDDGAYRCAIEAVPGGVTRGLIETSLCRQLRRHCTAEGWTFSATTYDRRKKPKTQEYKYHPKLELHADVGRKLGEIVAGGRTLTHMLFTKRSEKQSIGEPTSVKHQDFLADIEIKVSAKQAPADPEEKAGWLASIRQTYEERGFETKLYYRYAQGGLLAGSLHHDVAGATDLLICPKEIIFLTEQPKRWRDTICPEISAQMMALVDRETLWERAR